MAAAPANLLLRLLAAATLLSGVGAQVAIVGWNFDSWSGTSSSATTNLVGGTPSFSAVGTGISILSGGSSGSLSLSGWSTSAGNATQGVMFSTSSSSYAVTSIAFSQRISSTGPTTKVLQYSSSNSGPWTEVTVFSSTSTGSFEAVSIPMPSGASYLTNFYFRIMITTPYGGSMGSGGTFRLDDLYGELLLRSWTS